MASTGFPTDRYDRDPLPPLHWLDNLRAEDHPPVLRDSVPFILPVCEEILTAIAAVRAEADAVKAFSRERFDLLSATLLTEWSRTSEGSIQSTCGQLVKFYQELKQPIPAPLEELTSKVEAARRHEMRGAGYYECFGEISIFDLDD